MPDLDPSRLCLLLFPALADAPGPAARVGSALHASRIPWPSYHPLHSLGASVSQRQKIFSIFLNKRLLVTVIDQIQNPQSGLPSPVPDHLLPSAPGPLRPLPS